MSEISLQEEFTKFESIFVRHRNVLMVQADLSPIFTDYYVHLMEQKIKYSPELDRQMKDFLAALSLHLVARPWAETTAWTANLRAPRVNFFVTGSCTHELITGRLFTEDVREPDRNLLYSQTTVPGKKPRVSTIEVEDNNPLQWLDHYYEQSEQRPGKCLDLGEDQYVLFAAQPGYDQEWFDSLDAKIAKDVLKTEETKLLETRKLRFHCGCSVEKVLPALGVWASKPDELFQGAEQVTVQCPRCASNYLITPAILQKYLEES